MMECRVRLGKAAMNLVEHQHKPGLAVNGPMIVPASTLPRRFQEAFHGLRGPNSRLRVHATKPDAVLVTSDNLPEDVPSVYFEPFLRSFILGASAGAVFEAIHVISQFLDLLAEVGYGNLGQALPSLMHQFAPVLVDDHIVAAGCWLLFYALEVYAILKVLDKHQQNPDAAAYALRGLSTLPKRMLPRLQPFQTLLQAIGLNPRPSMGKAKAAEATAAPTRVPNLGKGTALLSPPRPGKPTPPLLDPRQESEGADKSLETVKRRRAQQGLRPGQLDLSSTAFLQRQKELASRRCFLRNFWYAVGISEQIQDKPVGVEILGEKVVLFRGINGKVICLQDVCPHRGAPLHMGWVSHANQHECIVCPYHGWAFDKEGVLRDVPAAEKLDEWPRMPLIASYPVEEKGGFIWLFYGSKDLPQGERPPIPYVQELEDPRWRPVYGEIEFDCSHWSVFENAIDMAHIHYLHSDSFGNEEQPQIRAMSTSSDAYGVSIDFVLHNKPVNALWNFSKVSEVKVNAKALLASTSIIEFTLGKGLSFITFVSTVPISATRTVNRFALIRRLDVDRIGSLVFNLSAWDAIARKAMIKILSQDKTMVEKLLPESLVREISVKADAPQLAFRKLRQEYIAMGYGVAPRKADLTDGQQLDF